MLVKLYVPRTVTSPFDMNDDEYFMNASDWLILQEVMVHFKSFEDLKFRAGNSLAKTNVQLRYPGMKMKSYPNGSVGDWYISLLNAWGDYVMEVKDGKEFPSCLETNVLVARMAEEMGCTAATAMKRLDTLKKGGHIKIEYGMVDFPKGNLLDKGESDE